MARSRDFCLLAVVVLSSLVCGGLQYEALVSAPSGLRPGLFEIRFSSDSEDYQRSYAPPPWTLEPAGVDAVKLDPVGRWSLPGGLLSERKEWTALLSLIAAPEAGGLTMLVGSPALRIVVSADRREESMTPPGDRAVRVALRSSPAGIVWRTAGRTRRLRAPAGWDPRGLTLTTTRVGLGLAHFRLDVPEAVEGAGPGVSTGPATRGLDELGPNGSRDGPNGSRDAPFRLRSPRARRGGTEAAPRRHAGLDELGPNGSRDGPNGPGNPDRQPRSPRPKIRTLVAESFDSGWESVTGHALVLGASIVVGLALWGAGLWLVRASPGAVRELGLRPVNPSVLPAGLGAVALTAAGLASRGHDWHLAVALLLAVWYGTVIRLLLSPQLEDASKPCPGPGDRRWPGLLADGRSILLAAAALASLVLILLGPIPSPPGEKIVLGGPVALALLGAPVAASFPWRLWPAGRLLGHAVRPIAILGLVLAARSTDLPSACLLVSGATFVAGLISAFLAYCLGRAQRLPATAAAACLLWLLFSGEVYTKGAIGVPTLLRDARLFEFLYVEPDPGSDDELFLLDPFFRGRRPSRDKGDRYRIMVLGGSVVAGVPLPQESREDYCSVLERLLNEAHPGRPFEVLNAGIAGSTSELGLLVFKDRLLAYRPDLVLLSYGTNDRWPVFSARGSDRSVVKHILWLRKHPLLASLRRNSRRSGVYLAARRLWIDSNTSKEPLLARRVSEAELLENYREFQTLSRAHGFGLAVMFDPLPEDLGCLCPGNDGTSRGPCEDSVGATRAAAALGLPLLDVRRALCGAPPEQLYHDDCHLTVEGNRRVAEELARQLRESGLLSH